MNALRRLTSILAVAVIFVSQVPNARAQSPDEYDVVVYGATPGGIVAAVAAAREKRSVAIVESSRHVGGMTTGGLSRTDVGKATVIGGLAMEFFERAAGKYDSARVKSNDRFYSEPHVAEQTFNEMLRDAGVTVILGESLDRRDGVKKSGNRIASMRTLQSRTQQGRTLRGKMFIDASYEGDLMAAAGVDYIVGRESRAKYGESLAGYYPMPIRPHTSEEMSSVCSCIGGMGKHYVHGTPAAISAIDTAGNPIFGVERAPQGLKPGDADNRTQAYNFRIVVTRDPSNRVPWPKPANYDASRYELLLRLVKAFPEIRFGRLFHLGPVPNGKFDLNAQGVFSTDYSGANTEWPDGDDTTREQILRDHINFNQGLLWFVANDERLPKTLREEASEWGLCRDEFVDNGHWPYQLYVREARRMVGPYVLVQNDLTDEVTKPDSVAIGSFLIDCHIVRRIVGEDGMVVDEGAFPDTPSKPYAIPYRTLTPKAEQCANLLVPVCMSASHIAYCSIRMEPQYMMMGHAAGLAASAAIADGTAVQEINVGALRSKLREQRAVLELPTAGAKK
jgi:hypothetical protein